MKAALFGLGRMGIAAAYFLKKLGYTISGYDINNDFAKVLCINNTIDNIIENKDFDTTLYDIVISCMPYYENLKLAEYCCDKVPYFDLGGHVYTSDRIRELNSMSKTPLFTDLGLAPGLISILGLKVLTDSNIKPKKITLAVGCIHDSDLTNHPTYYSCNWSIDGLINEYFDTCDVLDNFKIKKVAGLSGLEPVRDSKDMVMFNTSGGIGNFLYIARKYGVENCSYKTIRYGRHYDFLMSVRNKINNHEISKIIHNNSIKDDKDSILLNIVMENGYWTYNNKFIFKSPNPAFTSMQYITSGTLVAVADLTTQSRDISSYEGVIDNWQAFNRNMTKFHINTEYWI